MNQKIKFSLLKSIGPGFLLAGAAVGVSHLVQATRAGAEYGYVLWWVLLLAVVSKYPFLEFGSRFTAGTGRHLISGYKQMGVFPYRMYAVITVGSMFIIQAAVTIVTAGLAELIFGMGWSSFVWSSLILSLCVILLLAGKYPGLDLGMKIIISILTLATLFAVVMAFGSKSMVEIKSVSSPYLWSVTSIGFMIAFMGWMPIPLDASVWHSIWTKERATLNNQKLTIKGAFTDFNIGYVSAAFIGLLFFLLGILVMYGSGAVFADNSVQFSSQLIDLYGDTLGNWSKPIISIAAFFTMFSTVITVTDAYPRVLSEFIYPNTDNEKIKIKKWNIYRIAIWIIPIVSLSILFFLSGSFKMLIDFAAGLSFLSAPFLAWFNYKLITGPQMPESHRPGIMYSIFSIVCFVFLLLFCGIYLWYILI